MHDILPLALKRSANSFCISVSLVYDSIPVCSTCQIRLVRRNIRFSRRDRNYNFLSRDTCFNGSDLTLAKSRVEDPFELGFEYVDYQSLAHLSSSS